MKPAFNLGAALLLASIVSGLAQGARLTIERDGTDLLMRMNDLIPGDRYVIGIKNNLTQDIRDYWLPVFQFTPTETSEAVIFPPSDPKEFDIVVNVTRWQGPQPRLSIANGATLSGKVNLGGMVTDILPQQAVELWVDNEQVGMSTDLLAFELDTRRFANGPHTLGLVSRTVPFGTDGDFYGQGFDEKQVIFDNDVCFTYNLPMDPGNAMHLYTRETIDYRMRVFNQNGDLIRDKTGTQTAGDFDVGLDVSGPGELMEGGQFYRVLFTWTPQSSMAASSSTAVPPESPTPQPFWSAWEHENRDPYPWEAEKRLPCPWEIDRWNAAYGMPLAPMWNPPEGSSSVQSVQDDGCSSCEIEYSIAFQGFVYARLSLLLYCKYNVQNQSYESHVAGVMNSAAQEINFSAAVGPETDREVFGQFPRVWMSDSDAPFVLADIVWWENTHFIYSGHGGPDAFGASSIYHDTVTTLWFDANQIGQALGNTWKDATGLTSTKNPKRYVEINGCATGAGSLPFAFGIPKINLDLTGRPKQTFVGWRNVTTSGFFNRTKYQDHVVYLHQLWDGGMDVPIFQAIGGAIQAGGFDVSLAEIALFGSRQTTWLYNPDF